MKSTYLKKMFALSEFETCTRWLDMLKNYAILYISLKKYCLTERITYSLGLLLTDYRNILCWYISRARQSREANGIDKNISVVITNIKSVLFLKDYQIRHLFHKKRWSSCRSVALGLKKSDERPWTTVPPEKKITYKKIQKCATFVPINFISEIQTPLPAPKSEVVQLFPRVDGNVRGQVQFWADNSKDNSGTFQLQT